MVDCYGGARGSIWGKEVAAGWWWSGVRSAMGRFDVWKRLMEERKPAPEGVSASLT